MLYNQSPISQVSNRVLPKAIQLRWHPQPNERSCSCLREGTVGVVSLGVPPESLCPYGQGVPMPVLPTLLAARPGSAEDFANRSFAAVGRQHCRCGTQVTSVGKGEGGPGCAPGSPLGKHVPSEW